MQFKELEKKQLKIYLMNNNKKAAKYIEIAVFLF